ncbi:MAG TPA: hypothetical protein DEW46_07720 [Verrucomicrobia bacterium]|jgi:hypothetical protein|nr:hypothetical protein [Verrucomicrobiota bacterium]
MLMLAALTGCKTHPAENQAIITCRPVIFQNQMQILRSGGMPPPGEPDSLVMHSLILRDTAREYHVHLTSHRLTSILDTNRVYTFTIHLGGSTNHLNRLPSVIRVEEGKRTIYRLSDEMNKT